MTQWVKDYQRDPLETKNVRCYKVGDTVFRLVDRVGRLSGSLYDEVGTTTTDTLIVLGRVEDAPSPVVELSLPGYVEEGAVVAYQSCRYLLLRLCKKDYQWRDSNKITTFRRQFLIDLSHGHCWTNTDFLCAGGLWYVEKTDKWEPYGHRKPCSEAVIQFLDLMERIAAGEPEKYYAPVFASMTNRKGDWLPPPRWLDVVVTSMMQPVMLLTWPFRALRLHQQNASKAREYSLLKEAFDRLSKIVSISPLDQSRIEEPAQR